MPGQRFGYPVGSHYTGVRGIRNYLRHIRSTYKLSTGWRTAAKAYAKSLGKFALRGSGYLGAAAAFAEAAHLMYSNRKSRSQYGEHTRKRPRSDPFGYDTAARIYPDGGTRANRSNTVWQTGTQTEAMRGSSGILRTIRRKNGRRQPMQAKVNKLVKSLVNPAIENWRAMSNGYDLENTYILSAVQTAVGQPVDLPIYLFDLNHLYINQFAATGSKYGAGSWRLRREAAGDYSLQAITHKDNDNAIDVYTWRTEQQANSSGDNKTPYAFLDWIDIRALFNGPRKYPARVKIQMVSFTDPAVTPGVWNTSNPTTVPTASTNRPDPAGDDLQEWNAMWTELTAPLLANPINNRSHQSNGRRFRVIRSMTLEFQPRDTSDDGPTGGVGDMKVVKWFNNINRNYRFIETPSIQGVTTDEMITPQEGFEGLQPVYNTSPGNRARIFLMISASVPFVGTSSGTTGDNWVSFDLNLRRKWLFLEN